MVFPVVGGDGKPTGYEISNSLRFNDGDSPALTRTMGAPTSTRKFTYVGWLKRSEINANQNSFLSWGGSTYATDLRYESGTDSLYFFFDDNDGWYAKTKARYRDVSAWYQVVLAVDTTQATESNRVKLYVNGTQYGPALDGTDWTQHEIFGQNYDFPELANGQTMAIGKRNSSGSHFFDGYMSEIYFIDGQALDSSYFGETNDNGVWIPKQYDGTYGNNGFLLQFKQTGTSQNSSGIGADTSGNDNHFAVSNLAATDVTTDTPTNNFATFNPLIAALTASGNATVPTYSEGNCKTVTANSGKAGGSSTIQISRGKWYAEFEFDATNNSGSTITSLIGVTDSPQENARSFGKVGERANDVAYANTGNKVIGDSSTSYGNTYTTGDIIGVAVDLDNNAIYFSKNGTFQNSGDPTSGSTKTGAIALTDPASTVEGGYYFAVGESTTETSTHLANFGAAYPASISSGNSDGAGHGNFEYAVPSGYFALCTKNLATYG